MIGANADAGWTALVARAWSALTSTLVPLTIRPVATSLGSATVSLAFAAVLVTTAVVDAV